MDLPRCPRNFMETNYFHVMTQGIEKSYIFSEVEDARKYIDLMDRLMDGEWLKVVAYCVMKNHAHMLVYCENVADLSKFMQRLNTSYGYYYNKKYERVGFVFRDRFKSQGIYSERQLSRCIEYIFNNPVKAEICDVPEDYQLSNCKDFNFDVELAGCFGEGNCRDDEEFIDVGVVRKNVELEKSMKLIHKFLNENNIEYTELRNNLLLLKRLIVLLRSENISLRKISVSLGIGRETLRKLALECRVEE